MIEYKITNTPNTIGSSTFFSYTKTVTFFGVVVSCVEYSVEVKINNWDFSVDIYELFSGDKYHCFDNVHKALTSQLRSLGML